MSSRKEWIYPNGIFIQFCIFCSSLASLLQSRVGQCVVNPNICLFELIFEFLESVGILRRGRKIIRKLETFVWSFNNFPKACLQRPEIQSSNQIFKVTSILYNILYMFLFLYFFMFVLSSFALFLAVTYINHWQFCTSITFSLMMLSGSTQSPSWVSMDPEDPYLRKVHLVT